MSQGGITSISAAAGGTILIGPTIQFDVLVGGATPNSVGNVGPGTAGQVLQSGGAAANPAYSSAIYPATTTINQILFSNAANNITGIATANSGVLTTSTSGVPSIDTTNFSVLSTGVQVKGNNTNTAPPAGFLGELLTASRASGSALTLTASTPINITSIGLTAGIWDVCGNITYTATGVNTASGTWYCVVSATTASITPVGENGIQQLTGTYFGPVNAFALMTMGCGPTRVLVAGGGQTIFLNAQGGTNTTFNATAFGTIRAVRVG